MGEAQDRSRKKTRLAWPEAVSTSLGLLVLAFVLAVLGYDGLAGGDAPPVVVVRSEAIRTTPAGHLVEIVAENDGDATAATVRIVARLVGPDGGVAETREATFAYVPAGSARRGGLYFTKNPRDFALQLEAEGYVRP